MAEIFRLQAELDAELVEDMDRLQELGGLRTRKDLLENAMLILKWVSRETAYGASILSVEPGDGMVRELTTPFLDTIAVKAAKCPRARLRKTFGVVPRRPVLTNLANTSKEAVRTGSR